MKLLIDKGEYTASNCSVTISDDCKKISADSYNWWQFVATDAVGNVFFNNAGYSSSTSQHQSNAWSILRELNIPIAFTLRHTLKDMGVGIEYALKSEIKILRSYNRELRKLIKTPRTHKRKNAERRDEIRANIYSQLDARRVLKEYLDKKPIPIKRKKLESFDEYIAPNKYDLQLGKNVNRHNVERCNFYKHFFTKTNGVIKKDALAHFVQTHETHWSRDRVPKVADIDKIRRLIGLKGNDCTLFIIGYTHALDTSRMIPDEDSPEYTQLLRRLKRWDGHPRNGLLLEKIHTYLINKLNRKTYAPKEPVALPVHPKLEKLDGTPKLKLIKTDRDLKAEGRKQSHCIGGADYLRMCLQGYQALNYKGYTFFLDPQLRINQTHGRHNTGTPDEVHEELEKLIAA